MNLHSLHWHGSVLPLDDYLIMGGSLSPFALQTPVRLPYYLYSGWQVSGWWLCSNLPIYSLMWLSWALHHRHLLFGYALGGLHSCSAEIRSLHLRFVPLLYHNLDDLSRGFFGSFSARLTSYLPPSGDTTNPSLARGIGLLGRCPLELPFCTFIIAHIWLFVKHHFYFFQKFFLRISVPPLCTWYLLLSKIVREFYCMVLDHQEDLENYFTFSKIGLLSFHT